MEVLVVEDDDAIAESLGEALERERFTVHRVATGRAAVDSPVHDIVLLDVGLPDMDGFDVCRELRARGDRSVIIVLTARGDETDRVLGLEMGADDYVVKPFGFRELLARIRAVLRRTQDHAPSTPGTIEAGGLRIDDRTREVTLDDQPIELTPKEYDLLRYLAADAGAVLERGRIMEEVWDPHWFGPTKTIDVHVASLRRKLGDPRHIEAIRGVGFRYVAEP
ncbi:response regulator transcription factor [Actinospongicola halichondriae]|uniref:response regulator transcription factor n=1 Tax=Actinospongicola halichondriae TaxID=3236844 RepID=UPI003D3EB79A